MYILAVDINRDKLCSADSFC